MGVQASDRRIAISTLGGVPRLACFYQALSSSRPDPNTSSNAVWLTAHQRIMEHFRALSEYLEHCGALIGHRLRFHRGSNRQCQICPVHSDSPTEVFPPARDPCLWSVPPSQRV